MTLASYFDDGLKVVEEGAFHFESGLQDDF